MNTKLAICKGMGRVAHTSDTIKEMTYEGLHSMYIGESKESVPTYIHTSTLDERSNMLAGWIEFEGAGCVCHRENNCLGKAMSCDAIAPLLKKIKGMCAHFHRTDNVMLEALFAPLFMYINYYFCICFIYITIYVWLNIGIQVFVRVESFD